MRWSLRGNTYFYQMDWLSHSSQVFLWKPYLIITLLSDFLVNILVIFVYESISKVLKNCYLVELLIDIFLSRKAVLHMRLMSIMNFDTKHFRVFLLYGTWRLRDYNLVHDQQLVLLWIFPPYSSAVFVMFFLFGFKY